MTVIHENQCPICGQPNRCGEKSTINGVGLQKCWCAYETFPKDIFQKVPEEKQHKACICKKCHNQFNQDGDYHAIKLRKVLTEFSDTWQQDPAVSWSEIYQIGEKLLEWKTKKQIVSIWDRQPTMVTATLEDGIGQGLKMIHLYSRIAGIKIIPLGLMQPEKAIIDACIKQKPDFLGMTILQFYSEESLDDIINQIPKETQVVVGGPVFKFLNDEELAQKNYTVLNSISAYLDFLLNHIGI